MPSADRSQSGLISWLTALLSKLRVWTRQEIVSDDPWDRGESLFSDLPSAVKSEAKSEAKSETKSEAKSEAKSESPDPVSPSSQREP